MTPPTSLILGLGNDLISDDGFGTVVAERCRPWLSGRSDIAIKTASVAGFHLLDILAGYQRVLIVDVVQTGASRPGTLFAWPLERASAGRTLGGSHQTDLATTLAFGRSLGYDLPESISLLVIEAEDILTVHEGLTGPVSAAVQLAAETAIEWAVTGQFPPAHVGPDVWGTIEPAQVPGSPDQRGGRR